MKDFHAGKSDFLDLKGKNPRGKCKQKVIGAAKNQRLEPNISLKL